MCALSYLSLVHVDAHGCRCAAGDLHDVGGQLEDGGALAEVARLPPPDEADYDACITEHNCWEILQGECT